MVALTIAIPGVGERQIRDAADARLFSDALDHRASYYTGLSQAVKDDLRLQLAEYLPTPAKPRQQAAKRPPRPAPPLPDSPQARLFCQHAPRRPYCTNNYDTYGKGRILDLARAIQYKHIKLNTASVLLTLPFDIDRPGVDMCWSDVAAPTWLAKTPGLDRGHLGYTIEIPVNMTADNSPAMRFAAAVEMAYVQALGADCSLAQKWAKNPLHPDWSVAWPNGGQPISLSDMSEYVDLRKHTPKRALKPIETDGMMRNCCLFEQLRHWAYRHFSSGAAGFYELFFEQVRRQAEEINSYFPTPLDVTEIKHIAKSIAVFCWTRYRPSSESGICRGRDGNGPTRHLGVAVKAAGRHIAFDELPAALPADEVLRRRQQAARNTAALRAAETRQKVIDAIGRLTARGVRISSQQIATEAGLPRSTVRHHADLLAAGETVGIQA